MNDECNICNKKHTPETLKSLLVDFCGESSSLIIYCADNMNCKIGAIEYQIDTLIDDLKIAKRDAK